MFLAYSVLIWWVQKTVTHFVRNLAFLVPSILVPVRLKERANCDMPGSPCVPPPDHQPRWSLCPLEDFQIENCHSPESYSTWDNVHTCAYLSLAIMASQQLICALVLVFNKAISKGKVPSFGNTGCLQSDSIDLYFPGIVEYFNTQRLLWHFKYDLRFANT